MARMPPPRAPAAPLHGVAPAEIARVYAAAYAAEVAGASLPHQRRQFARAAVRDMIEAVGESYCQGGTDA